MVKLRKMKTKLKGFYLILDDLGKGDKKSARCRAIKRITGVKDDVYGRGLNSNRNQQSCHHYVDPNNLIERIINTRNKSWSWLNKS